MQELWSTVYWLPSATKCDVSVIDSLLAGGAYTSSMSVLKLFISGFTLASCSHSSVRGKRKSTTRALGAGIGTIYHDSSLGCPDWCRFEVLLTLKLVSTKSSCASNGLLNPLSKCQLAGMEANGLFIVFKKVKLQISQTKRYLQYRKQIDMTVINHMFVL